MSDAAADTSCGFVNKRWVHVEGDDTEHGAVYRDAAGDIPLSRRPKDYLEFDSDGTVRRLATGPDDRARETDRTRWSDRDGSVHFTFTTPDARGQTAYRIASHTGDQLVVQRGR